MNKRIFFFALYVMLLAINFPVQAQEAGRVYRIGFLRTGSSPSLTASPFEIGLREGLRELGYIEGRNLVIEYRSIGGRGERRPEIAVELVRLKVDVIVTSPGQFSGLTSDRT